MLDQLNRPVGNISAQEMAYQIVKRAASDPVFLQNFFQNPDDTIRASGVSDPTAIVEIKNVIGLMGRGFQASSDMAALAKQQWQATAATADAFKNALRKTIDQIDAGFQSTMTMSKVAFYLGIVLIVSSGVYAVVSGKTLLSLVFSGLGAADIIGFFVVNPPRDIQHSRANLAQLQAALYNWFNDVCNWNGYLGQLSNQTTTDPFPRLKEVSSTLLDNTERMMGLIDKYCEVTGDKPAK